jgi:hypothetical protein
VEHVIAGYLRYVRDTNKWLFKGQHVFTLGYKCESQIFTVCQDIVDSLDEGARIDAIIIDFSKPFNLVPIDRLLMKIASSGVDARVVVWEREFLLVRSQRFRVGGHLSQEVRVTSVVPQWDILDPLLFLAYINDVWRNTESTIRLSADDCIIYRRIKNDSDIDTLQIDLDRMGVGNAMKTNPG